MEIKFKQLVLTVFFAVLALTTMAQVPSSAEEKRAALLTPEYYTNWIGASFLTIATIEKELEVTPAQILNLTFFYDFGTCFVGMEANEKGVITQMTLCLFGEDADNFVKKALDYGYEKVGTDKNVNIRSNTGKIVPDVYNTNVIQYRKTTKNGKVYLDVANSGRYANEYEIAIYRTK